MQKGLASSHLTFRILIAESEVVVLLVTGNHYPVFGASHDSSWLARLSSRLPGFTWRGFVWFEKDLATHLHVIQPVRTFLDPFLPEWATGCSVEFGGEFESELLPDLFPASWFIIALSLSPRYEPFSFFRAAGVVRVCFSSLSFFPSLLRIRFHQIV